MKLRSAISVFILLFFSVFIPETQAQWSSIPAMGAVPTDGCVSFSAGGKGYVIGGSTNNKVYCYDTTAGSWSQKMPHPEFDVNPFAMAFDIAGKFYIVGGDTAGAPVSDVWMYDPALDSWEPKNAFPGGPRDAGFGFALNGFGYVGAGFSGTEVYDDFWKYDPVNDEWTELHSSPLSVPMGPVLFPSSFVVNGKAYLIGGGIAPDFLTEIKAMWMYDPASDTWEEKADFPGDARQAGLAFSIGNYGFFGGGMIDYLSSFHDMWRYDPAHDQWTPEPDMPLAGPAWATAFTLGDYAFAGTGADVTATGLTGNSDFFRFKLTDSPSGLNTITELNLLAYPNPAETILYIFGLPVKPVKAAIYDISGRQVRESFLINSNSISVDDLSPGIYTVKVMTDNSAASLKFIRQ